MKNRSFPFNQNIDISTPTLGVEEKEVADKVIDGSIDFQKIHSAYLYKKDFLIYLFSRRGDLIQFLKNEFIHDPYLAWVAVRENGLALRFVKSSFKKSKDLVREAVQQNGLALKYAHISLKGDKQLIIQAIQTSQDIIKYIDNLNIDKEIVVFYLSLKYPLYILMNKRLLLDKECYLLAIENKERIIEYIPQILRQDRDLMLKALQVCPSDFKYMEEYWKDEEFCRLGII